MASGVAGGQRSRGDDVIVEEQDDIRGRGLDADLPSPGRPDTTASHDSDQTPRVDPERAGRGSPIVDDDYLVNRGIRCKS
jgi:hypothetical protein